MAHILLSVVEKTPTIPGKLDTGSDLIRITIAHPQVIGFNARGLILQGEYDGMILQTEMPCAMLANWYAHSKDAFLLEDHHWHVYRGRRV